ncbi:hypothetical protein [Symbioplanes lichenis]|uniref:hypothetical protein n=1 Tax=Symbioplanes lichenis TaxID=1629072 RepID=UPI002739F2D9|nr:hypothetical protein [Actinoplanes lichenis]
MERRLGDLSDVSVAVADGISDDASLYRRPGSAAPFRRPPAASDFPDTDAPGGGGDLPRRRPGGPAEADTGSWNAFAAAEPAPGADWATMDSQSDSSAGQDMWEAPQAAEYRPEPAFGPAPPATNGRTAFGFTAGPISGHWRDGEPVSGAPAAGPPEPAGAHSAVRGGRHHSADQQREFRLPGDEHIGDLVGEHPHEIRPHRAAAAPAPPRRNRGVMVAGLGLTAAVLFGGGVAAVSYFSDPGGGLTSVLELGSADQKTPPRTVFAPIDGRTQATFEMLSGAKKVTVRSADIGDSLYRMTTAEESGMVPEPVLTGNNVQLSLAAEEPDTPGTGEVEVTLSTKVTWSLLFSAGAEEQILNLEDGRIAAIDFAGAAQSTTVQLPEAAGTIPVKVTGAVDQLAMTSPEGNPVRVKVKGGAQTVAAGSRTLKDIAPGSTLTPKNWATDDRFDVEAESRVTLLTVATRD